LSVTVGHAKPKVWEEYCPNCNEYNFEFDRDLPTAEIAQMPTWCSECHNRLGPYQRTKKMDHCPLCGESGNILVTQDPASNGERDDD